MKNETVGIRKYILGIFLAVLLLSLPLFKKGMFVSDDGEWMVIRLSAFYQSLREGQFPVRFLGRLNNEYGYPVANFLYPGFLYFGSALHLAGLSFVDSVKAIFFISVLGSGLFIFFWLQKYFDSKSSFWSSILFIFNPYLIYDLYIRGSVGEVFSFLPAAISLYALEIGNVWLFPISIAILILSHNSTGLLFLLFIVGYIVCLRLWKFVPALILGIFAASFFWIPALSERQFVVFDSLIISNPIAYFVQGHLLILLGPVAAVVVGAFLLGINRKRHNLFRYMMVIFFVSLILSLPVSVALWNLKNFAKFFQFPYRFLSIILFAGTWLFASYLSQAKDSIRDKLLLGILITEGIIAISLMGNIKYIDKPLSFYTTNEATTTVADEYMPRWVQVKPTVRPEKRIEYYTGKGTFISNVSSLQRVKGTVFVDQDSILQFNTIYYPGWGATVDDQLAQLDYQNPLGVMRFSVPKGQHRIHIEFRETILRFLADCLSLVGFGVYVLQFVRSRVKKIP